jgi:hypothetical protein
MAQSWQDLLFAHWPVPAGELRRWVPEQLPLDTFDGTAWIAVTPFRLRGLRMRLTPPVPGLSGRYSSPPSRRPVSPGYKAPGRTPVKWCSSYTPSYCTLTRFSRSSAIRRCSDAPGRRFAESSTGRQVRSRWVLLEKQRGLAVELRGELRCV